MATAGSGKVNKEIRTARKSRSRTRSRSKEPHSNDRHDDIHKERRHRDKSSQERIPPSLRSSSPSSSSSPDSRQAAESRPRPTPSSVIYHAKSRKRSCSCSYSSQDRSRSDKRGCHDNQIQGSKTGKRNASEEVTDLAFRVQRMESFLEQIDTHMGLSNQVSVDAQPGPGGERQRPVPTSGPHHNGALPKRSMDLGRMRDDDEVSLLTSDEGILDPPQMGHDLPQVCFNPVPEVTPKWSPHEVIASYVSKYFGSKTDKGAISAQILEGHGAPYINNFVVPQLNQAILMAPKVQSAKNVLESDKHVANVQQMLMSASYPLLKFWSKIILQEEDFEFEAEELLKDIQQSLCVIGSSFQSLNTHRRRRCLAKEFFTFGRFRF